MNSWYQRLPQLLSCSMPLTRSSLILALVTAVTTTAFASPRSDAWKLRRSNPEQALAQLQQAAKDDPEPAKVYWFIAMIDNDLGRGRDGLQALQTARQLDPALSFASNPDAVSSLEASLTRKAGGAGSVPAGQQPPGGTAITRSGGVEYTSQQEVMTALNQTGVYVAPQMRSVADPDQIAARLKAVQPPPAFKVNVLVFDDLPTRFRSIWQWAQYVHKNLSLRGGLLVVATRNDIGADGGNLSQSDLQSIIVSSKKTFLAEGYPEGIAQVVRLSSERHNAGVSSGRTVIFFIFAIPAGIIVLLIARGKKRSAADLAQVRQETRDLSTNLAPAFEKLDSDFEYALLGEQDPERKRQLQERRQRVGQSFSDSMKRLNTAATLPDFVAARNGLQNAQAEIQRAQNVLKGRPENEGVQSLPAAAPTASGAMGPGTGRGAYSQPGSDVIEMPPVGANYPGAQPGYALDFFTSQPVPVNQMVPVEIEVNGERRRVWASPQSAQNALSGNPQIATVPYQGQQQPWFDVPQYNPWHDFGSSMLQMAALGMVFNAFSNRGSYYQSGWHNDRNYYDYDGGGWMPRDSGYEHRMSEAGRDAGQSSFNDPFGGAANDGGASSLDVFGGGGVSGGGSS